MLSMRHFVAPARSLVIFGRVKERDDEEKLAKFAQGVWAAPARAKGGPPPRSVGPRIVAVVLCVAPLALCIAQGLALHLCNSVRYALDAWRGVHIKDCATIPTRAITLL
jgi:hypothetical protein